MRKRATSPRLRSGNRIGQTPINGVFEMLEDRRVLATITVNSTGDLGDSNLLDGTAYTGQLNSAGANEVTLRAAIQQANANAGADTIIFNIPTSDPGYSSGAFTISPSSQLPAMGSDLTIEGISTKVWVTLYEYIYEYDIILDGSSAGSSSGLTISGSNSAIEKMQIENFGNAGIAINGSDNLVDLSLIQDNGTQQVLIDGGDGNLLNEITVYGDTDGILLTNGAQGNTIEDSNVYAVGAVAITVTGSDSYENSFHRNSFYSQAWFVSSPLQLIDLGDDGLSYDDSLDQDAGANKMQNRPHVTHQQVIAGPSDSRHLYVEGYLQSTPNTTFDLDLIAVGAVSNGYQQITTDQYGYAEFDFTIGLIDGLPSATYVLTATDPNGNTSEAFSSYATTTPEDLNSAPEISADTYTISENLLATSVVGTPAFSDPDAEVLTFAITSGNTGGAFAIDEYTGEITVAGTLDHTATSSYSLTVQVTDVVGATDTAAITINVVDGFDIDIVYDASVSLFETTYGKELTDYVEQMASVWEGIIVGDIPAEGSIDDLELTVYVGNGDGPGGVLAAANVDSIRTTGHLPYESFMIFDYYDTYFASGTAQLSATIFHELGHALGFVPTVFDNLGLLDDSNPSDIRFTGANAVAAYQALGGTGNVPLDSVGSHFRESVFTTEIMTPTLNTGSIVPISAVTIAVMEDLGYEVSYYYTNAYFNLTSSMMMASSGGGGSSTAAASNLLLAASSTGISPAPILKDEIDAAFESLDESFEPAWQLPTESLRSRLPADANRSDWFHELGDQEEPWEFLVDAELAELEV
ncbi:cadherin domain-containing protein [Blastopirellula retiformator]|uniref:Cadherin domain protein n=1 Tax=Blastopirellula retiformator TaxID=2527970 RepID=A0A5C5UZQ4_9BACT|nr:cadherin domain-containing protein [Blastopirellula retiformator]TWT31598.1 Cadherin domain protein [Blastopirellula retiformator]